MTFNHLICPTCGHDFYTDNPYGTCAACGTLFYASESRTCEIENTVPIERMVVNVLEGHDTKWHES